MLLDVAHQITHEVIEYLANPFCSFASAALGKSGRQPRKAGNICEKQRAEEIFSNRFDKSLPGQGGPLNKRPREVTLEIVSAGVDNHANSP